MWIAVDTRNYEILTLVNEVYALPIAAARSRAAGSGRAALVRLDPSGDWALVAPAGSSVRVNGIPAPGGLAVLADRDEIRLDGGHPIWFSTEAIATVAAAPHVDGRTLRCPRCNKPIDGGTPAVRCPACGVWSHETEERNCFTYEDAPCAACRVRSELDGLFRWSPEEL